MEANRKAEEEEKSAEVRKIHFDIVINVATFYTNVIDVATNQVKAAWGKGLAFVPFVNLIATPILLGGKTDNFCTFLKCPPLIQKEQRAAERWPMNCSSRGAILLLRGTLWRTK